jgi:putative spermidine/putrescine transport system substrate-binding protein
MKQLVAAALLALPLLSPNVANGRDLTVVGFGGTLQDAFRKAYFEPYSAKTGTKIIEDTTNGGLAKQKVMVQTGNITWDIVQLEEDEVEIACDEGLVEKVDWSKLENYAANDARMFHECAVGAIVWSEVLTYDASKIKDGPKSWADFWNTSKWPGKRGMRKQPKLTLELALLADGVPKDKLYEILATKQGQDRAFAKLDELKPHIQWWESGAQPLEWLASGSVVMTAAFSGRVSVAQSEGKNFPIVWDGQLWSVDYWSILAGTPNKEEALKLVNYMISVPAQKAFVEAIPYGITNTAVARELKPELLSKLPSADANLSQGVRIDTTFWIDYGQELTERFARWVAQ